MTKRKCKTCGRQFIPTKAGEQFCSMLCRTTGLFVGGGGDTRKPGATSKQVVPEAKPIRVRAGDEKYERVRKLFTLPQSERWELAKTFTEDEQNYSRRLARRQLAEEDRLTREWTWDSDDDVEDIGDVADDGSFGDSDDGSL